MKRQKTVDIFIPLLTLVKTRIKVPEGFTRQEIVKGLTSCFIQTEAKSGGK